MLKLAVIFGGRSTEHDVSLVSGSSVICHLDKDKYEVFPIYIDKNGRFYRYLKKVEDIQVFKIGDSICELEPIDNIFQYLEDIDVVFPVLHGKYGEDGTVQGMLDMIGKKYVGCKVFASSLCMDKMYAKVLFRNCGIEVAKSRCIKKLKDNYIYINEAFDRVTLEKKCLLEKVNEDFSYPVFVKPSNSGSSVGVYKVNREEELLEYLEKAFHYDSKVLIEEAVVGREVECAVLGNEDPIASDIGEVFSATDFYSYDSKYKNRESTTAIPAVFDQETVQKIRDFAVKAYLACDCRGLSRVDFFVENGTNRIVLNEINTLPGFTEISMYPQLMEHMGFEYAKLLDKLVELAME